MNTQFWLIQAFNGISYAALLFLVGSGLSLIFGVMRIVNLAHGSYFLLGGYVALSVIWTTGSWVLAIPVAALTIAALGLLMERIFLRPLGFDPLRQVLLTVGFAFLFQQAALDIWTGNNFDINPPEALTRSVVGGGRRLAGPARRQLRQGAVPRGVLFHPLRADGPHPGGEADRPVRAGVTAMANRHKILMVVAALVAIAIVVPQTNAFVILLVTRALAFSILVMSLDILLG